MPQPIDPSDRPDPNENMPAMRARVPEHVSRGVFSTGVIVMTGNAEFILDFVQNLGRPHQVVARIVLPHVVLPQFSDALSTNIDLYTKRFGPLPNPVLPGQSSSGAQTTHGQSPGAQGISPELANEITSQATTLDHSSPAPGQTVQSQLVGGFSEPGKVEKSGEQGATQESGTAAQSPPSGTNPPSHPTTAHPSPSNPVPPRRPTAQEVYDDLKLRDEILSGSYANAVMIGHGPHEFSFDFITNFYPQSAVSARVFLAAGQVSRLLDSLRTAYDQLRPRNQ